MTSVTATLASANDLLAYHSTLIDDVRRKQREHRRVLEFVAPDTSFPAIPPSDISPPPSPLASSSKVTLDSDIYGAQKSMNGVTNGTGAHGLPARPTALVAKKELTPAKAARAARYKKYVPEEETIRNDYSQHYVDSGEWPQNFVLGAEPELRFEE